MDVVFSQLDEDGDGKAPYESMYSGCVLVADEILLEARTEVSTELEAQRPVAMGLSAGQRVHCDGKPGIVAAVIAGHDGTGREISSVKILLDGSQTMAFTPADFSSVAPTGEHELVKKDAFSIGQCIRCRRSATDDWKNGVITHVDPHVKVRNVEDSDDEFDAIDYEYDDIIDENGAIVTCFIWDMGQEEEEEEVCEVSI